MNRQNPIDIVMTLWKQFNTSPWITLERIDNIMYGCALNYEMKHSKTHAVQTFQLDPLSIHTLADHWTRDYVVGRLTTVLAALTHNTVEAGVSSFDVYREEYPA